MIELAYCRSCRRRHRLRGWREQDGLFDVYFRDDSVWCPKRKMRIVSMRHERTGRPMPV